MGNEKVLFSSFNFVFGTLCTCKVSAGLTSYFYVAKLFKQSRRGDVKFIRKHQRKQEKYLKIRVYPVKFCFAEDLTGRCEKIHPDAYQQDVREDVFFILLRYSLKK